MDHLLLKVVSGNSLSVHASDAPTTLIYNSSGGFTGKSRILGNRVMGAIVVVLSVQFEEFTKVAGTQVSSPKYPAFYLCRCEYSS